MSKNRHRRLPPSARGPAPKGAEQTAPTPPLEIMPGEIAKQALASEYCTPLPADDTAIKAPPSWREPGKPVKVSAILGGGPVTEVEAEVTPLPPQTKGEVLKTVTGGGGGIFTNYENATSDWWAATKGVIDV